jgi:tRNA pseudouridine55 synthase
VDGVIVVDKPVGPTSFDVVAKIRRAARVKRVGHGGTLDPLASGVLPVCLGEATKLAPFLLDADKEYEFTVRFGVETETDDAGGAVVRAGDTSAIDERTVRDALGAFRGPILQVPPAYAAIKREGKALYAYAREGIPVDVPPRAVTVFELELLDFAGHVTALRRTRSGPFSLAAAQTLADLLAGLASGAPPRLVSLPAALANHPTVCVDDVLARRLRAGQHVAWTVLGGAPEGRTCVVAPDGELVAVAEPRPDGLVRTLRVFGVLSQKPARKLSADVDEGAIL